MCRLYTKRTVIIENTVTAFFFPSFLLPFCFFSPQAELGTLPEDSLDYINDLFRSVCVFIMASSSSFTHCLFSGGDAGTFWGLRGVSHLLGGLKVLLTLGERTIPRGTRGEGFERRDRYSIPRFLFTLLGSLSSKFPVGTGVLLVTGVKGEKTRLV